MGILRRKMRRAGETGRLANTYGMAPNVDGTYSFYVKDDPDKRVMPVPEELTSIVNPTFGDRVSGKRRRALKTLYALQRTPGVVNRDKDLTLTEGNDITITPDDVAATGTPYTQEELVNAGIIGGTEPVVGVEVTEEEKAAPADESFTSRSVFDLDMDKVMELKKQLERKTKRAEKKEKRAAKKANKDFNTEDLFDIGGSNSNDEINDIFILT
jgi:hypothetical protein